MRTGTVDLLAWTTAAELARLAGVDVSTARRWQRGVHPAPPAVVKLLELWYGGHVGPRAGLHWRGWYFDGEGLLCAPDIKRARIDAPELRAYL